MRPDFTVALAGPGEVGSNVACLLEAHSEILARRTGRPIRLVALSGRDRGRERSFNARALAWYDDPVRMARECDCDCVLELIGGAEGIALATARAALESGKALVTANKAMLAQHGVVLARLAESKTLPLKFEAAIGGGIPIVKTVREGLCANRFQRFSGILNGTCNYILTRMSQSGCDFASALAEARKAGYAEADAHADISGADTAQKLALLVQLAFGASCPVEKIPVSGISHIAHEDMVYARRLGYRIRLLGIAERVGGRIALLVSPALVPERTPLASVDGVFNAVLLRADFAGDIMLRGAGAGGTPTASAVCADLIDIARGYTGTVFARPAEQLTEIALLPPSQRCCEFYLRVRVRDQPGVLAALTRILAEGQISIESALQYGRNQGKTVPLVIITHATSTGAIKQAGEAIGHLEEVEGSPQILPVETA